jgi:hypothetical protein
MEWVAAKCVPVSDRPRRIDEDLMLVEGIRDLEPGHLMLLERFDEHPNPAYREATWSMPELEALVRLSPVGLQAAIGGLLGRGLIRPVSGFDGGGYRVTEFGTALLGALRRSKPS